MGPRKVSLKTGSGEVTESGQTVHATVKVSGNAGESQRGRDHGTDREGYGVQPVNDPQKRKFKATHDTRL
jgi:hypothetical protein